jgi:hypothetical protein
MPGPRLTSKTRYVRLYQSLAENSEDNEMSWDSEGTRRELYATILAATWYRSRYQLLDIDIEVRVSPIISTLRWDLSSGALIITQRGPMFPAMLIDKQKMYYSTWHTELWTSLGQCRRLPLENTANVRLSDKPHAEEVRQLFQALQLDLPREYDEAALNDIVEKAFNDPDPYTRGAGDSLQGAKKAR